MAVWQWLCNTIACRGHVGHLAWAKSRHQIGDSTVGQSSIHSIPVVYYALSREVDHVFLYRLLRPSYLSGPHSRTLLDPSSPLLRAPASAFYLSPHHLPPMASSRSPSLPSIQLTDTNYQEWSEMMHAWAGMRHGKDHLNPPSGVSDPPIFP